ITFEKLLFLVSDYIALIGLHLFKTIVVVLFSEKLLEINNLTTSFRIKDDYFAAVDDVSLTINKNEVLAIVGESGSGKSALAFSLMGLHKRYKIEGNILFKGENVVNAPFSIQYKLSRNR